MKQRLLPALFILALAILQGCKKDNDEPAKEQELDRIYVLNQGGMGQNNSGITLYNLKTSETTTDFYKSVNGSSLGETANDLKLYGSKLYCVVCGKLGQKSSFVDVINSATGKSIKRISFNSDTEGYLPRFITFYKDKAYVSAYDGKIRRIDTASLAIDKEVQTGGAMEDIAVANNKIYVANSVHFQHPTNVQNSLSVIDLSSFTKIKDIPVANNPQQLALLKSGDLLVTTAGNYDDIAPSSQVVSTSTDAVSSTINQNISYMAVAGDKGYAISAPYGETPSYSMLDLASGKVGAAFITAPAITTPYGIAANPVTGDAAIMDAMNYASTGKALYFTTDGKLSFSFATGPNPSTAVFIYTNKK